MCRRVQCAELYVQARGSGPCRAGGRLWHNRGRQALLAGPKLLVKVLGQPGVVWQPFVGIVLNYMHADAKRQLQCILRD